MSIESRSNQYGTVFEHWQIKEPLGSGSGGRSMVFRLHRADFSQDNSALKVISLIEEKGKYEQLSVFMQKDYQQLRQEYREKATKEVELMAQLRGHTHIVDYLDHKFVDWSDQTGFGCDMLIRMERLQDLRCLMRNGEVFTEAGIIKIGLDICEALKLCHGKSILHRDIKPENIFRSSDGYYKLGDFGISRILDASPTVRASTDIGTPAYSAPEQLYSTYDMRVDLYSLGLVLYELANGNKLPFAQSSYIREGEIQKRQMGVPIPPLTGVSRGFNEVILKACAFRPEDRYQSILELRRALEQIRYETLPTPKPPVPPQPPVPPIPPEPPVPPQPPQKDKRLVLSIMALAAAILCLCAAVIWMTGRLDDNDDTQKAQTSADGRDDTGAMVLTKPSQNDEPEEQSEHNHYWIGATKFAPDTCESCGMTRGRSLGTPLTECDIIVDSNEKGSKTDVNIGNWIDCFGTVHADSLRFWVMNKKGWSSEESIYYDLHEQYQEMDVCIQLDEKSQTGATAYVNIYLDGQLLETSRVVDKDSSAVRFTVHVGGTDQLCIECVTDASAEAYCIVDATLYVT